MHTSCRTLGGHCASYAQAVRGGHLRIVCRRVWQLRALKNIRDQIDQGAIVLPLPTEHREAARTKEEASCYRSIRTPLLFLPGYVIRKVFLIRSNRRSHLFYQGPRM